jgi:hypothetical protein
MTVTEIVIKYLEENGYDGLYNCDVECGCSINDFTPCGYIQNECQAGYANNCVDCKNKNDCSLQNGEYDIFFTDEKCNNYVKKEDK